ncbi:hypothetical protein [Ferruginibacter albus]|uniref:hypothetical protein n=1 Tax=Ferruginibacter albus TaxID=2875540 RepID=UPI001CC62F8B|nr:hypothetical protein [Ferruginibacter albus]UAY51749.1 hypothetical protein K9M53_14275 [Ferruginibacter albus]
MKLFSLAAIVILLLTALFSCSKDPVTNPERKIRYILYTNQDFSGDKDTIRFTLLMHNHTGKMFDSAIAPMTVENIPDFNHKIVIDRLIPNNDTSTFSVGFSYYIDNVGLAWSIDTCSAGVTYKEVRLDFK